MGRTLWLLGALAFAGLLFAAKHYDSKIAEVACFAGCFGSFYMAVTR